ncbi:MAG: insulinase family protein, partial [Chloroflexi bacterium]|nr:insulinase family protein [Chloroflexota bacterium]
HMAIRQTQAQFAYANESVSGQALSLGFLAILDRPERMDTLFEELAAVTPEDVQRVARTYLTEENRTVGWFVPSEEGAAREARPSGASRWAPWRQGVCFYRTPKGGIGPESIFRTELDNGAVVLVHEKHDSATLVIGGQIRAGSYFDPPGQEGLAGFVAAMLRRGTARRTFQEINLALDAVGASLEISAGRNDVGFGGHALAEDADLLISLLGEMLMA